MNISMKSLFACLFIIAVFCGCERHTAEETAPFHKYSKDDAHGKDGGKKKDAH